MKTVVSFLFVLSMCMAFSVMPNYIATKNTGDENFEALEAELVIDCSANELTATIMANDSEHTRIANAKTYLFYTNYAYQIMGTGVSDENGVSIIRMRGNAEYLTSMFVFRVDATGYRSQEIEFTFSKCLNHEADEEVNEELGEGDGGIEEEDQAMESDSEQNNSPSDQNLTQNISDQDIPQNISNQNTSNQSDLDGGSGTPDGQGTSICPIASVFLLLIVLTMRFE